MNITLRPGAAVEDAASIDTIIAAMQEDMATLDRVLKATIPEGIQTTWSDRLRTNWESYYNTDVPAAMEAMKLSATNLRLAIQQALQYDQER